MYKYFTDHNNCTLCGSIHTYTENDDAYPRCCACNKIAMYFYHDESDSVVDAQNAEEVDYFFVQGLTEITYHQFWSFNMGLGL